MEIYLLKSAACLALLFAFYKLVLENTSIHSFKRFYLFGSLMASFLIPLITFTSFVEASPVIRVLNEGNTQVILSETEASINYWPFILWTIYSFGVLFFSVKFFRNLFSLIQKIRKNPKFRNHSFINILLSEAVIPHTFFNYIFLDKKQFENREIPAEVMLHEETHARQKHSLDVIFVEILQILFWFNPLFYFIKRSIKLNHEFLADRAVLNAGVETSAYQKILLAFSSKAITPSLAHSLNYSSIKKRFTIMKTHTSRKAILFRSLLLLPLLSALIYGFSTKEVVEIELSKKEIQSEVIQQKATKAEIAEYNKLAIKYNAVDIEKRIIKKNDLERLEIIYKKMTDEQKANAEPFPECIPPPPPTSAKSNMDVHNMRIPKSDSIVIYYKEKVISLEEADDLVEKNKVLSMNIIKSDDGKSKVFITEKPNSDKETSKTPPKVKKGEISDIPPPPPAPKVKKGEKSDIPPPPPPPSPKVIKGEKSDIPPPPPPPNAPKVKKGEKSNIPPPPPPPPSPKVMKGENSDIPPPPPPNAPKVKKGEKSDIPPPPPPAPKVSKTPSADNGSLYTAPQAPPTPNPDPVEYIKELGKRGATFYIGPHKYNTDEAIELVRKSKDATIDISKYPEVHLGGC